MLAAEDNFNRNINEMELKMSLFSKKLLNQAKRDAELEFNTNIANFKRDLERKYINENNVLLQDILNKIKLNEESRDLSLVKLTEAEGALSNKLLELDDIKQETDKYLQIKEDIENSLSTLAAKTRQIAQIRKQLSRILPEFKLYYRNTGTPCPFILDVNKDLDVDVFQLLYESLRDKIEA